MGFHLQSVLRINSASFRPALRSVQLAATRRTPGFFLKRNMSSTTEAVQQHGGQPAAQTSQDASSKPPGQKSGRGGKMQNGKRQWQGQGGRKDSKQRKSKRERNITEGSSEEVLAVDVQTLIASRQHNRPEPAEAEAKEGEGEATEMPKKALPDRFSEIEVEVLELSSTGDGLAVQPDSLHVYVVPFVVPGDVAKVKVVHHMHHYNYSLADFVSVIKPSPLRDDSGIKCKYFSSCGGCQLQMLDYDTQLAQKRTIVEKAYKNFSKLTPELVPTIRDTIGSPLQYNYRTKLTPHFDNPNGSFRKSKTMKPMEKVPDVGFNVKGRRTVLDIEDCPIGTDVVRLGLKRERARVAREFGNYTKGATILLRESTLRYPKHGLEQPPLELPEEAVRVETDIYIDIKTCISEPKGVMASDYIDSFQFTYPANAFFQNNNSILPKFTDYIRKHAMPPEGPYRDRIKYLIDAYSGSGLFTITLASLFKGSMGIDIAKDSIECAKENAALNHLPKEQCNFMTADASELFKSVKYPADETVVVIDPPRKGCDGDFLSQLLRYGPRRIVYVSCNVHTQARDVGVLVRGEGGDGTKYEIESLVGFDFFPQTAHVEGVAVLNRSEENA